MKKLIATILALIMVLSLCACGRNDSTVSEPTESIPSTQPSEESTPSKPSEESAPSQPSEESTPSQPSEESAPSQPSEESTPSQPSENPVPSEPPVVEKPAASEGLFLIPINNSTAYAVVGIGSCEDDHLVIPSEHNGLPVTTIKERAFYDCSYLYSVYIPASITTIEEYAFSDCGLNDIYVEEGHPVYHVDNNCLIETATKTLMLGTNNSVIPSDGSVTGIGAGAFSGCTNLKTLDIPDTITSIGHNAFSYCTNLTAIIIPEGVTKVSRGLFYGCTNLKQVSLPSTIQSVEDFAFDNCENLWHVSFNGTIAQSDTLGWWYWEFTVHCLDGDTCYK